MALDFAAVAPLPFGTGIDSGTVDIAPDGASITLTGNAWKQVDISDRMLDAQSVLRFEFRSDMEGDVHAIGFDGDGVADQAESFLLFGTDSAWGIGDYFGAYAAGQAAATYEITLGDHFTDAEIAAFDTLVFVNDDDTASGVSTFSNVEIL